jgi:hypothetical protein
MSEEKVSLVGRSSGQTAESQQPLTRLQWVAKERDIALNLKSFLSYIVAAFQHKLYDKPIARLENVRLSFQSGAHATVIFRGHKYRHDVPGHAGIVGQVYYRDGTRQTVFQRFISHPFWQYSHQTGKVG